MNKYCPSLVEYKRFKTRIVNIGDIPLGANYPIRIQSMTTTNTLDIESTINQSIKIFDAGSDYVRITAPSIKEAEALKKIKKGLKLKGYSKPIIADIHFTPNAAIEAAKYIEKVRINPGNYADRKQFKTFEYSDQEYADELNRIYKRFSPLVNICKENGTAMRIGTNHGSLSDRIMNRYGDTPIGMVESAMEFIRICEDNGFYNIVLSMKSSNPIIMVEAYRYLVNCMIKENMNYPLHLGVTEAGEGMEGRIKSSIGIGTLLEDGLGDTIRVSLTEDPEHEIPVAKKIVNRYSNRLKHDKIELNDKNPINPFEYNQRKTHNVLNIGGSNVPRVINDITSLEKVEVDSLKDLGYNYIEENDKWEINEHACDYIYIEKKEIDFKIPGNLGVIQDFLTWKIFKKNQHYPLLDINQYLNDKEIHPILNFLYITSSDISNEILEKITNDSRIVLFIDSFNLHGLADQRSIFVKLINSKSSVPVIIGRCYHNLQLDEIQINSSVDIGGLFVDGLGDGLFIYNNSISIKNANVLLFEILQATRRRITKTDFISCPSCGRTQFDLMETTSMVREKTSHLKGLKIAIMGCIVNGPGEMADADYGYVGTGKKIVSIYKKHEVIEKNIPANEAVDKLIDVIKENNDWIEPK